MADNFKEIGSLFGREGAGVGFAKQTDKESFTYAFAWPEGDTWATLTGYLNLDEQPEEYVRRVLQDGGFRSDWDNPDYDPIGDFKETAGDEYRIPLLKVLLREQLESRYEVANHFSTMNRARVELSAFIQNEGGAPLPEDALGTPEEQGIRAMLIATGEPPREVTLLPDKNGSTLKPLQALVGGNIETFDIAFELPPISWTQEMGGFFMAGNALYDVGMRLRAAELHDEGHGRAAIAALLGMPEETVREWLCTYRSAGIEVLAMMGKKHTAYSFETKLAAVRAVVDEGMTKPEAMEKFGIASPSPFKKWLKAYREEGPEALRPKPRGRPRGSGSPSGETTREQELERRIKRLEAENAYLKKSIALKAEKRSRTARRPRS